MLTRNVCYRIGLLLLILVTTVHAQASSLAGVKRPTAQTITGQIKSETGEPLPGATIIIEGTSTGTSTDAKGNYSIDVPDGSGVLVFSFVGYVTERIPVQGKSVIDVTLLPDVSTLSEVVVIGYGSQRKEDVTGAIASVNQEKFNKGVISSTEQLIQGKVAGLTVIRNGGDPTSGSAIRLRGGTSLTASSAPLVVVDGVPGADLNTISPNDIASMEVLKDAAATAIYGARGANGVIIINTKKPQAGKVQVDYNGYVSVGYAANYIDMLSANQWRKYVRDNNLTGAVDYGASTDWQKEILQTSVSHSHSLSLSGGNDKSVYRASLNYLDNQGIVLTSGLKRLNGKLYVQQKALKDKLTFDVSLSSTFDDYNTIDNTVFRNAYNINPTVPVYDSEGQFFEVRGLLEYNNPVAILKQRKDKRSRHRFLGVAKLDYAVFKDLHAVLNTSFMRNDYKGRVYLPINSAYGMADKGFAQQEQTLIGERLLELYLNYDKKLGDHAINLVGGYSYFGNQNEWSGAVRRGFDTDEFGYNNMGAGQDFRAGDVWSGRTDWKLISFFGRANYNYKGKYLLSTSLRRDGSSKFGRNNKWGLFPSVAVGWNISDEAFLQGASAWLTNLKVRAGYGVTGNQEGIDPYKSLALSGPTGERYYDPASDSWKNAYGPIQNPNPDLKWESTAQLNVGVDFNLFNRISGTLDYYSKNTSDLLYTYQVPQPPYIYGTILANVGNLTNKGVELTLNTSVLNSNTFRWDINFNFAYNRQKITKLSSQVYTADEVLTGYIANRGFSNTYAQVIKEGYVPGTFWGLKATGLDENGKYTFQDLDGSGTIDDKDKQILGNAQPDYTAGLGMNFGYGNFDLSFSTNGIFGQKLLNAVMMSISDEGRLPTNNVPDDAISDALTDKPQFSSYWLESGSFVRLQNVSVGYRIPAKEGSWLHNARVYVTGENLFVITGYSGADPEISLDGLAAPGIDNYNSRVEDRYTNYPRPRTFSLGASLSF